MKAYIKPILTCLLCFLLTDAMAIITVKGRLASATDDTPLAGATMRMLLLPDSTLLIGSYSDKEGLFSLTSSRVSPHASSKTPQKLLIVASYMGYQTSEKIITIRNKVKEYDLKDVYMQEDARLLGEALVSATPPPVMVKEDTVEYFADSYKTQPDATAEDLLKRLPGVEVAEDGSVTAHGETVQQIYVDGKEFFGRNTQVTTKNLTADMIESVQVVDMKTEEARLTGIDDGERRKVINLKLKPKMRRGWFGNAAAGWGSGHDIDKRWDGRGMIGYFRGHSQNALTLNGNNTNNAGFGDVGNNVMQGSAMRSNRRSGARGDGLNSSWSAGINLGYDEGNRMRDPNSPLAINGNVSYGGSSQDEESRTQRTQFLKEGSNTETESYNTGHNVSQNLQVGLRYEKTWGNLKEGQHRLQFTPSLEYNDTETNEYGESHNWRYTPNDSTAPTIRYLNQSQDRRDIYQHGYSLSVSGTYSYARRTSRGRRRSSVTLTFNERMSEGDAYTRSYTSRGNEWVDFDPNQDILQYVVQRGDTLINQWNDESSHNESYRIRLTHVEPIADKQTLEFSANANLADSYSTNLYYFWDGDEWSDSINGRSNIDYSSDTWMRRVNYDLSVSYRKSTDTYNFSAGMNVMPQSQEYKDYYDHTRDYKRHYVNYSPRLEYRYRWSRHQILRITLNGQTTQPSMNQLQARKNQTSASHVRLGNADLSPSLSTNFNANYRSFNDQTYVTYETGLSARASFNNLVTKRWYSEDLRMDTTMTVNLSGIGNWNANGFFRGSWPFYDNMWYVTSNTSLSYSESDGYASLKSTDAQLNTTRTYNGSEEAGIAYRGEKLNVELRGNYNVQHSEATITTNNSLGTTHRFGFSTHLTAYLPLDFTLSTDFRYTGRRGFSAGVTRNQSIWNAQLSRSFLQRKNLSTFVKVFDILRQKSAIARTVNSTGITDRETTVLGQFFLIGASIKFNKMGGGQRPRNRDNDSRPTPPSMDNRPRGGFPAGGNGFRPNEFDN